jgi:hypothetical protein
MQDAQLIDKLEFLLEDDEVIRIDVPAHGDIPMTKVSRRPGLTCFVALRFISTSAVSDVEVNRVFKVFSSAVCAAFFAEDSASSGAGTHPQFVREQQVGRIGSCVEH